MLIKVFIDTNVLVDVLIGKRTHSDASLKVFETVFAHKAEGVIATQSMVDASYILRKIPDCNYRESFMSLSNRFNLHNVDSFAIYDACTNFTGDFEDDALFSVARAACCDVFITSDKAFISRFTGADSHILVMTPEEFLERATA